jgi:hypothetical protein
MAYYWRAGSFAAVLNYADLSLDILLIKCRKSICSVGFLSAAPKK